jgi:hypothetical protein
MPVKLNGATSGSVTIDAPAVAGTNTLTLPAVTDTLVGLAATQTLTNKIIQGGAITSATAQASTSGTSIDFTSIPSWVKRITVIFSGVSESGTSIPIIQIGDSGGIETTGYLGSGGFTAVSNICSAVAQTSGFSLDAASAAASIRSGAVSLYNISGNVWVASGTLTRTDSAVTLMCAGTKTLSDTLTQVRITTVNGTDTFDAGTINIMYE